LFAAIIYLNTSPQPQHRSKNLPPPPPPPVLLHDLLVRKSFAAFF
jgi:hypothetical protein